MKKRMVIANWKLHPETVDEALDLFDGIKDGVSRIKGVEVVIAPPFVFLPEITAEYRGSRIEFAGQDLFYKGEGSFTGEVSAPMLKSVGASYVIIGHSERRALGENNEDVQMKVEAALADGLRVILCIGERERNHGGEYLTFLLEELTTAFENVNEKQMKHVVIAYEPIWAIGKDDDDAMQPTQVHEMVIFIKKFLTERFNARVASNTPILYGGSVEPPNAEALFTEGEVDGFLVGHASLDIDEFSEIVKIVSLV